MIGAIILAAGESGRMGTTKALLRFGQKTFVRHLINELTAGGVTKIAVVVGADSQKVIQELVGLDIVIAENPDYAQGQLSSVVRGIEILEPFKPEGILVCPVDHPGIDAVLIKMLVSEFHRRNALIVLPTYNGKRGHPVLFSARVFGELKSAHPDVGARSVVWVHKDEVIEVNTETKGVIQDIDTQKDYEDLQRNLPGPS